MNNLGKNIAMWVVIGLLLILLFNLFQGSADRTGAQNLTYTQFINKVDTKDITSVELQGNQIKAKDKANNVYMLQKPDDPNLVTRLLERNVEVVAAPADKGMHPLLATLISWLPLIIIIGLWIFFMRQMQSGGGRGGAMGFGKSRARMLTERQGRVTFDDVAGVEEAKTEVQEIVEFLRDP